MILHVHIPCEGLIRCCPFNQPKCYTHAYVHALVDLKCQAAASSRHFSKWVRRQAKVKVAREQLRLLECRIWRDTPTPPVFLLTCCKQLLGCEACFHNCMEENECCPLCRDPGKESIVVEGLHGIYTLLKWSPHQILWNCITAGIIANNHVNSPLDT